MHLGTPGDERLGARIRASEPQHLMARIDEFLNNGRTDKAGRPGDENTHHEFSLASLRDCLRSLVVAKLGAREKTIYAGKSAILSQSSGMAPWIRSPTSCRC